MNYTEFSATLARAADENGISSLITPKVSEHLFFLANFLISENQKYNLTAIKEHEAIIYKHFVDSLLLSAHIPENSSVIDVGCGAGFPSLPLAIARPDLKITSLDSTDKKITFIKLAAAELKLQNITAITARAEEALNGTSKTTSLPLREHFDIATARAVASLPVLCELCIPFLRVGGRFVSMKGPDGNLEHDASHSYLPNIKAGNPSIIGYTLKTPESEDIRTIISIEKLGKTPDNFPRNYSQIRKKPLA